MTIRTADQYQTAHRRVAPRSRRSDRLQPYDLAVYSRPDHAARAVSIEACFPLAGRLSGGRPGHPGHEAKTPPMDHECRLAAYQAQNGGVLVTPRQYRRIEKHHRRTLRPAA